MEVNVRILIMTEDEKRIITAEKVQVESIDELTELLADVVKDKQLIDSDTFIINPSQQ